MTKHPRFPGYIFKLYLDAQRYYKDNPEYHYWILRVQGAEKIRHEIAARGLDDLFKVPKKWIYPLPKHPTPSDGYVTKYYLLVEEDMDIVSAAENKRLWVSHHVSHELLDGLYAILKTHGLHDCVKPDNIPFSRDGRVAFVDTQTFNQKVNYKALTTHLSESNKVYWKSFTW